MPTAADPATDRSRRLIYAVAGVLLALVVGGSVAVRLLTGTADERAVAAFGVGPAAAGCGSVLTDEVTGPSRQIGPGTALPDVTRVAYDTAPPSWGDHTAAPLYPTVAFYAPRDAPIVEQLVHNLAHGYTILWYDPTLPQTDLDQIRDLAVSVRTDTPKFVATAWDRSRGDFPDGARIALSHWGAAEGYRQYCATLSGEAVADFVAAHPATDSPDPDGA